MPLLDELNPPQREAVTTTEGAVLVLAGAGSGKTRVLTYRIAHLLEQGLATPGEILAVTFTNKAAGEVRERVSALCGAQRFPYLGTFHSICVRILRKHGAVLGYPSAFSIYDTTDQATLVKEIAKGLGQTEEQLPPRKVLGIISRAKNRLESPEMFARQNPGPEMAKIVEIYRRYQQGLMENGAMDFDDLLVRTVDLFTEHEEILAEYQERFRYILIDEYQDVNFAQYVIVKKLAEKHRNICVVGDDDQSIYGFRGADVSIIGRFEQDWRNAKVVKLEQNYRSTQAVLDAANAVIQNNPKRKPKTMWTDKEKGRLPVLFEAPEGRLESSYIIRRIKELARQGKEYGDFAVLYRTNAQSRAIEEGFKGANVPYQLVGGTRFYDRKEIRDLVAYLRVVVNPSDDLSLRRVINVPTRGIGTITLNRLDQAATRWNCSLYDVLRQIDEVGDITPKALSAVTEVRTLIEDMQRRMETTGPRDLLERLIKVIAYKDHIAPDRSIEAQSRLDNVNELITVAAEFEKQAEAEGEPPTLELFLTRVSLVADVDQMENEGGSVTLMTLHSAKGLEFPVVFLSGLEDGLLPHARVFDNPDELEEERRLCYVGMTRARERLFLTHARSRRNMYGDEEGRIPSRFLSEIPSEMVEPDDLDAEALAFEEQRMRYGFQQQAPQQRPGGYPGPGAAYGAGRAPTPTSYGGGRTTTSTTSYGGGRQPATPRGASAPPARSGPVKVIRPTVAQPPARTTSSYGAPRPERAEPRPAPVSMYKPGQDVTHKVFGQGRVSKVSGDTVTADFPGFGEKTVKENFLSPG